MLATATELIGEPMFHAGGYEIPRRRLRNTLVVQEIARRENIVVIDQDVLAETEKVAAGATPDGDHPEAATVEARVVDQN